MAFNLRDEISIQFGISTSVIHDDGIPKLYPTECSICRDPRGLSRERRRTTMISNPGARGGLCFIAHHRVLPGFLPFHPSLFSNYIIPTRESYRIFTRRINLKKKHSCERRFACESSSNPIYRDAPETFPGITLASMIFQGFVYVSAAIRFHRIVRYSIRLLLRADTV